MKDVRCAEGVKELTIEVDCAGCKHSRPSGTGRGGRISCERRKWYDEFRDHDICEDWKPKKSMIRVAIDCKQIETTKPDPVWFGNKVKG